MSQRTTLFPRPPDASKSYFGLSHYGLHLVWLPNFSSSFEAQQSLFCVAFGCSNLRQRELCSRLHSHLLHMVMIQLIHNCVCSLFSCSSDCDLPSSTTDVAKEPQITQNHPLQP